MRRYARIVKTATVLSPDKQLTATLFSEYGGGAAGYTRPNVAVHRSGTQFSPRDKLLLAGTYCDLSVTWLDARTLKVSYSRAYNTSGRRSSALGVRVIYKRAQKDK